MEQQSAPTVETITPIPGEMLKLIPLFDGDKRHLNLFIRKSEYVIVRYRGSAFQDLYVYHAVTSRLTGDAAALLSEREDVASWSELKQLLEQHFGDPRSEECIAIELENLKIKHGESFLDFCNRIQSVRSNLMSKINMIQDEPLKKSKIIISNSKALEVFLYNLPEDMVRIVRLNAPKTLEDALRIVLEEVNFHERYNLRNKNTNPKPFTFPKSGDFQIKVGQHFANNSPFLQKPTLHQRFGALQPNKPGQNFKPLFQINKPQFGYRPPFNIAPQQFGYRPQINNQFPPKPFGYRPQFGNSPQFGNRPQFGYRPQFGNNNQPQFGYKPPQAQPHITDVSMRTAPIKQDGFKVNDLELQENPSHPFAAYLEEEYDHYNNQFDNYYEHDNQHPSVLHPDEQLQYENKNEENFHETASIQNER